MLVSSSSEALVDRVTALITGTTRGWGGGPPRARNEGRDGAAEEHICRSGGGGGESVCVEVGVDVHVCVCVHIHDCAGV